MNERINELRLEAGISRLHDEPKFMVAVSKEGTVVEPLDGIEKFAKLIVQECVAQCRQEWYDLNNTESKENETARDIGIRVGQKNGVLKTISRITQHFGIE